MTTRNERKKRMQFFCVGLKRLAAAYTWCWCIYVIWSCIRFLSLFLPHWPVSRRKYHRCNGEKKTFTLLFVAIVCPLCIHAYVHCIALHFIVLFIANINTEMALWATTNKTCKNTHSLHEAKIPPGCTKKMFDCYLSLQCIVRWPQL